MTRKFNLLITAIESFNNSKDYDSKNTSTIAQEIGQIAGYENFDIHDEPSNNEPTEIQELRKFYKKHENFIKFYSKIIGPNCVILKSDSVPGNYVTLPEHKNVAVSVEWKGFLGENVVYANITKY